MCQWLYDSQVSQARASTHRPHPAPFGHRDRVQLLFPGMVLRLSLALPSDDDDGGDHAAQVHALLAKGSLVACVPCSNRAWATLRPVMPRHQRQQTARPFKAMASVTAGVGQSAIHPLAPDQLDRLAEHACLGRVLKASKVRIGPIKCLVLLIQGLSRVKVDQVYRPLDNADAASEAFAKGNADLDGELPLAPSTASGSLMMAQVTILPDSDRVSMLALDTRDRLERLVPALQRQLEVVALSDKIRTNVAEDIKRRQRELILRKQLEVIRKELNQVTSSSGNGEGTYPPAVVTQAKRDLKRLQSMSPSMAEYHTLINSCDTLLSLPWSTRTPDRLDLGAVRAQLDADHFGLDKVKQRILEYVAVRKLQPELPGPILCLVGPPGVGKTSIAKSVAAAMGRTCERVALGGVRDEAEIRGHRRTYVGAMPGLVARALRHAGTMNPVMVLDEVDKLTRDSMRGDPAAALLEVLDPEQNCAFVDHYVQVPLDLSQVVFVATCNSLEGIPKPLLDRMEVIEVQGYTMSEKREIALRKLVPKQMKAHGLGDEQPRVEWTGEVVEYLVSRYTRESGVRSLERAIAGVCRGLAVEQVNRAESLASADAQSPSPTAPRTLTFEDIHRHLGPVKFDPEPPVKHMVPGLVQGLAWTGSGQGAVMLVEASAFPGKGNVQLTGQLGSVLQESAALALTWLRSHAHVLGLVGSADDLLWGDRDLHVHLPAGAVAKDGPSAGVALATALVSLALGVPARDRLAMTGEIDLQGNVLPVGGIREKATAAAAAGVTTLLLPARNAKDIDEIPKDVREQLRIVPCEHLVQVLREAFDEVKVPGVVMLAGEIGSGKGNKGKGAVEQQLRPRL
ncbi:Lon protease C-terminal proteolytic domain-domain-containing protein [Catenaria anguillulae PL171]|uniref:endopeptidase La n=1 Tax=Catenaria anguillulae PL171 TaxID=765915 RepID=A0A1Y2HMZ9_9FUNG|nr:Lon protease C-terminal proteolytic domain-domain-containing protein [Catenaria anguillulae PL171]